MSSSSVCAPITMRLPFTPSSVSVARHQLKSWMDANEARVEAVEDAGVVISELVANAVRHARPLADGQIHVSWELASRVLQLTVTDGGSGTRPRALQASSSALAGRGMAIVDVLAHEWWSEQGPSRTSVHALMNL